MGSTGMRTVVAVCGVLAIAGACSSGSKHVSAGPSSSRADDSTTVSSTRAVKRPVTKHAVKAKTKTATTATTSGAKSTSGNATVGASTVGSVGTAGAVVVPTTAASGGSSSQYVVGPVDTTTRTTVKPFDATKPIDLSGTPGVTAAEQLRAETLLRNTMRDLPKYATPAAAIAAGYRSIHDHFPGITNDEHYVNWAYLDDGHLLDSKYPESLVYEFPNGTPKLVAAMYIMPIGSRFTDVPDVGGALTQWHVHNNLCLIPDPSDPTARVIYTVVPEDSPCPAGSDKASVPMLHVWIVSNPCGPFAALEGIGAGQVPDGETRNCDTLHASAP